jgi:hypothetical protein
VEGALRSSSCLHAHHSMNYRVLMHPLPLLLPTSTMAAKARVRAKERGKVRTTTLAAPTTTARTPLHGPPTIAGPTPSRCGQGCVLQSSSQRIHRSTPCSLHRCTMGLLAVPPSGSCRCLHYTCSRPQPLLGHPGRARGISGHWPTHGLDSPSGHRLGCGLRRLQPHHLGC